MAIEDCQNAILAVFTQVSMLANLSQLTIFSYPKLLLFQVLTANGTGPRPFPCTVFGIYVAILIRPTVATGQQVENLEFDLFYAANARTGDPGKRSC